MLQQLDYTADIDFLTQLALYPTKTTFARINIFNRLPNEETVKFAGVITGGSCNIDGDSSLRRTCSLNLSITEGIELPSEEWALQHMFDLEIGLENHINPTYDNVIWFPLGRYVIKSFGINRTTSGVTVSISGQDPMVKLNGSQGGTFPHEIDFGTEEIIDASGNITEKKVEIQTIIEQAIRQYSDEQLHNIAINDLPEYGLELLEYRGKTPLYMMAAVPTEISENINAITTFTLDETTKVYIKGREMVDGSWVNTYLPTTINSLPQYYDLNTLNNIEANKNATKITFGQEETDPSYYVIKLEFGETIGYKKTSLVYPGDLILKAGDNIVTLLDKIKNMLGNFEYFYDTNGVFVLQKKKDYQLELFSPANGDIINPIALTSPIVFDFTDDSLIVSKNINPPIDQIKNDFVVWRKRAGANGGQLDIHARYALDTKPTEYTRSEQRPTQLTNLYGFYRCQKIDNNFYLDVRTGKVFPYTKTIQPYKQNVDTREIALVNYTELLYEQEFYQRTETKQAITLTKDNSIWYIYQALGENMYKYIDPTAYYSKSDDLSEENPMVDEAVRYTYDSNGKLVIKDLSMIYEAGTLKYTADKYDWRELIYQMALDYQQGKAGQSSGYETYYADMLAFWRLLYDPNDSVNCYLDGSIDKKYWNKEIYTHPEKAIFWLDFLDVGQTTSELGQYNVQKIGRRQKVDTSKQDKNTTIFQNKTPEALFSFADDKNPQGTLQLPRGVEQLVAISSQGVSAIEDINDLIAQHACCTTQVNINAIPMYWLQPNTRIHVHDIGDLIINKIQYNLNYNGMMTLTCTKAVDRIF